MAVAFFLGAYLCLIRQKWWACGVLLGMSMLVRETGGLLVLAVAAGLVITGKRREALIVGLLAFLPIVLWKGYVGWAFWSIYGFNGLFVHPADVGVPFAGVWELWATIARGDYFDGRWEMTRAGLAFPLLTTAGAALAVAAVLRKPSPMAIAALGYGILTITFNYELVWVYIANAHRLTSDLFVALALVFLLLARDRRVLRWAFAGFWCASAWYVFFGTYEARAVRESLLGWFGVS